VAGLVEGWLEGNRMVRENAPGAVSTVAKSFKWTPEQAKAELDKVHLANLPENLAYFSGAINSAGSFGGIYQSAVLAYGSLLPDAPPYERFIDQTHLQAIQQAGKFAEQKISLAPIRSGGASALESDPLLTKDIRFYFEPNSAELILNVAQSEGKANQAALDDVSRLLRVSPGSVLMLVGHVDDSKVKEFQREGAAMLQRMRLEAVQLSKNRAEGVRKALQEKFQADAARLQTDGKGWDRPVSKTDPGKNRRVEVQWYTLE
jgi:NitT/TauT family transport system substrate-binding protein